MTANIARDTNISIKSPLSQRNLKEHESFDLDLVVTIVEVGAKGRVRRVSATVNRLTREADGVTAELIAQGATIDARYENGKEVFELAGNAIEGKTHEALELANLVANDDWRTTRRPSARSGAAGSERAGR
jgi:hypothetical protein